jgi:hypothetical protein
MAGHHTGDVVPRVGQQLEHTNQHGVVAQHVFIGHGLAQRHNLVAVMPGQVVAGAVGRILVRNWGAAERTTDS